MTRTLFFCVVLWKFSEITNNKTIFRQFNIFYKYKYLYFKSGFWSLFNNRQKHQSNQEQCSLSCSSPCFSVFLSTHYGSLQCFSTYFRNMISSVKRNWSFTTHISRLCYFLWLYLIKQEKFLLHSVKELCTISITNAPFNTDWLANFWKWATLTGWFEFNITPLHNLI